MSPIRDTAETAETAGTCRPDPGRTPAATGRQRPTGGRPADEGVRMEQAPRPVIMLDVALAAGVSIQTVSRVLNESPAVRPETRTRVLAAVTELGYRPNAIARALVNRRATAIGVIAVDTRNHGPITTLLALERAARAAGYGLTVVTPDAPTGAGFTDAYRALVSNSVAGAVVIAPQDVADPVAPPPGLPTVAVEADSTPGVPTVRIDQRHGVARAVDHLAALGHRRIDHIAGPPDWAEARERLAGWRWAVRAAGLPPLAPHAGNWTAASGHRWAHAHARDPEVTAVVAANDDVALGVLRGCWELGVAVPGDLSVVGFDDIPVAAWAVPGLTTVRQDFDALGSTALEMLLRLIGDDVADTPPPRPPLPELVVRQSTAAPGR